VCLKLHKPRVKYPTEGGSSFTLIEAILVLVQEVVEAVEDHAVASAAYRPVAARAVTSKAGGTNL